MRTSAVLVVEQELGERAGQLGLADAGRAEEQERADRPARILEPGARAADRVGHGLDRLVLADDPLVEALLHLDQLRDLALHQPADRDARSRPPTISAMSSASTSSLSSESGPWSAASAASCSASRSVSSLSVAVLQLGRGRVVGLALGLLDARGRASRARPWSARMAAIAAFSASQRCFIAPACSSMSASSFSSAVEPRLRCVVLLLAQRLALDLELDAPPLELVELDGHRVDLHAQA